MTDNDRNLKQLRYSMKWHWNPFARSSSVELSHDESDFLFLVSLGGVVFTYLVAGYLLANQGRIPKAAEQQIYLLAMIPLPPLTVWLARYLRGRLDAGRSALVREWNFRYLFGVIVYAAIARAAVSLHGPDFTNITAGKLFISAPIVNFVGGLVWIRRRSGLPGDPARSIGVSRLVLGLGVLCLFFWPGEASITGVGPSLRGGFTSTYFTDPLRAIGLAVAIAAIWLVIWAARRFTGRSATIALMGMTTVLVILSFDPHFAFDYWHYAAYVGPAIRSLHGGIPFLDAYGQYGLLPNVVYTAVFLLIPKSLFAAGLATSVINVLHALLFMLIVVRSASNRWLSACGVLLVVWFHNLAIGYNLNMTPSMGGMRFLPGALLLFSLSLLPPNSRFRWHSLAALVLAGLWSVESAAYALGTYTAFLVASGMLSRRAWTRISADALAPSALVLLANACLSLIVFSLRGEWPHYGIYWQITRSYTNGSMPEIMIAISPDFYLWSVLLIIYFSVFLYVWKARFWNANDADRPDWQYISVLFPAAVMGTLEASYFVIRSIPTLLATVTYPLGIVILVALDRFIVSTWCELHTVKIIKRLAVGAAVIILSVIFGRLLEPLSEYSANSTMLRRCLSLVGCSPTVLLAEWKEKLSTPSYLHQAPPNETAWQFFGYYLDHDSNGYTVTRAYTTDGIALARKFANEQERLLVFLPREDSAVLFYVGKQHRLTLSDSYSDAKSETLLKQLSAETQTVDAGEVVITTQRREALVATAALPLLAALEGRFRFCELERTSSGLAAYRLTRPDSACPTSGGQ